MGEELEKSYQELVRKYQIKNVQNSYNINLVIRKSIQTFVKQCENVAIWCYGIHTKILMADFMNELKSVRFIIDQADKCNNESGFEIIKEQQIISSKIDGVIISSYKFKDEIINKLNKNYPHIKYLDFYQILDDNGIHLLTNYYSNNHPYEKYLKINEIQRMILTSSGYKLRAYYRELIGEYVAIKDFRTAVEYAHEMYDRFPEPANREFIKDLNNIYKLELVAAESIRSDQVLMICFDGLRDKDIQNRLMPNLLSFFKNKTCFFCNAYSSSTSTYESLIPAYSNNNDLRTRYYEQIPVPESQCPFIQESKKQCRNVYFYTDSGDYVESNIVSINQKFQTATEKIWDFIIDAVNEQNGLFYLHILYESHFSYPNPYTDKKLIADGTNVMFDYLKRNGGKLRTDYNKQHQDALRYLDDVVTPFLDKLNCRMVIYADHGNIIPNQYTDMRAIEETKYTFHEELIRIPMAIKSPECGIGLDENLVSIMSLNDIIISLMRKERYKEKMNDFVKVQRSEIYNPDFRFLYKKNGYGHDLLAFEVFIFKDGYKMAIFSDGLTELFNSADDSQIEDLELKKNLFCQIREALTVCEPERVKI